jgi:hypothetical protein
MRPQLSSLPPQWLAEPTPTKRKKATAAPSPVVPATICLVGVAQPPTVVAGTKGESAALPSVPSVVVCSASLSGGGGTTTDEGATLASVRAIGVESDSHGGAGYDS